MSPRKLPFTLYKLSLKSSICLINSTCNNIEKVCDDYTQCEQMASLVKDYLVGALPASLFGDLCNERSLCYYYGDPRIQFQIVTHPKQIVYKKCTLFDDSLTHKFWIDAIPNFENLIILDLKFICTDEILEVIGRHCLLLREINIVSKVDINKSEINAYVLSRNVSDVGLQHISKLKGLRIVTTDPPKNVQMCRKGRCVSQAGIVSLVSQLPLLEEIKIETCDIAATLIRHKADLAPLNLQRIKYHLASPGSITDLAIICPHLKELSFFTHMDTDQNVLIDNLTNTNLILTTINASFFAYSQSVRNLLSSKGYCLTHFAFADTEKSLSTNTIIDIGKCCPQLVSLNLLTTSHMFKAPKSARPLFTKLKRLTIGSNNFDIEEILSYFLNQADITELKIQYETKLNIDNVLLKLLAEGKLDNLCMLYLDFALDISQPVIIQLIQSLNDLRKFTLQVPDDFDYKTYIRENNYQLVLNGTYC